MSSGNIFSRAVAMIEGVAHSAHNILCKIFGSDAVHSMESQLATIFREDVLTIFADAVDAANSLKVDGAAATGEQKRQAAFDKVASDLKTSGVSLANNAINLGIELAVGFLKSKASAVASAPSTPPANETPTPAAT